MKTTVDNDSGVAYAFFMIMALIILGALMWMAVTGVFNQVMVSVNSRISDGQMSQQTAGPIQFGMGILAAVPVFLLIGILMWSVLAAINKRNGG